MLSALGWQGFRNRLAEAYLHHEVYNRFPEKIDIDEVSYVIDFERRFDFLSTESNSRIFLLGMYLKQCELYFENSGVYQPQELNIIPPEVDEILILGKSKSLTPDWLIVIVWSMYQILGKDKTAGLLTHTKGNMAKILTEVTEQQYALLLRSLLRYGQSINDTQFFVAQKV